MNLADVLSVENALVSFAGSSKTALLHALCTRAAAALGADAKLIACEIEKREALGSTGVGKGVAIPHARIANIDRAFGALARLKRPIDFDAIDGQPVDLVFLLILPKSGEGHQLNVLASVARRLRDPIKLQALREASDGVALQAAMVSG